MGLLRQVAVACGAAAVLAPLVVDAGVTKRVSVRWDGSQVDQAQYRTDTRAFWVSGNGRYVGFSGTPQLLPVPPRSCQVTWPNRDCHTAWTYDRALERIEAASVSYDGGPLNGSSYSISMSADGRYAAFSSSATNVIPPGPDLTCPSNTACGHVFVRDRLLGTNELVSQSTEGIPANELAYLAQISADGNTVAFSSYATNLIPGGTPDGVLHTYVRDRRTGKTTLVSSSPTGEPANKSTAFLPSVSADGNLVVFSSDADNLVENDTNTRPGSFPDDDVFVKNRATGAVVRANLATDGTQANDFGENGVISGNGRFVLFSTSADNLVAGDSFICGPFGIRSCSDLFVHDLVTRTTELISRSTAGVPGNDHTGRFADTASISYDGRYVAFTSEATNLDPPWARGGLFLRDREKGTTERLDLALDGGPAEFPAFNDTAISHDGRIIAFASYADDLVPDDTNDRIDVFVLDRTCANAVIDSGEHCDDGNGVDGDSCTSSCTLPACRGGGLLTATKVKAWRLGRSPSRARLQITGRLRLPVVENPFSPSHRGAQIVLEDAGAGNRALFDLSSRTTPIPPFGFGCDHRDGWRNRQDGRIQVYRSQSGALPEEGCRDGSAGGLEMVRFTDRRHVDGTVEFTVRAASETLEPLVGPLRLAIVLGENEGDGAKGLCGGRTFAAEECTWRASGRTYVCETSS